MSRKLASVPLLLIALCLSFPSPAAAQQKGTVEHITVHGASLAGNLIGDSPDRKVIVYLPPSYNTDTTRRYPVVYLLHGYTDSNEKWFGGPNAWMNLADLMDADLASGTAREMLLVVPNAFNAFHGAFYSSSITTGDWEDFIARDLVSYIDCHYRTLAKPESRGLAGHSMGGYGTLRIGIRHSDVFSSIYALSPCCLNFGEDFHPGQQAEAIRKANAVHTLADVDKADFGTMILFALSAAWSPDPKAAPLYLDLPTDPDGHPRPEVLSQWSANMPIVTVPQHIPELRRLHALAFDAGIKDEFKSIPASLVVLDEKLNSYRIAHTYETYDGTHTSRVPERLSTQVLPFFSRNLAFQASVEAAATGAAQVSRPPLQYPAR